MVALPPRFAGAAAGGTVCARTVELVDVMPTLCDLAGVPLPEGTCDGRSLAPVLLPREGEPLEDRPAITEVRHGAKLRGASVRTVRYRYTEWNGGAAGAELYDHDNDPHEMNNLAKDYTGKPTTAPRVGPPLPGDLGRPMLNAGVLPGASINAGAPVDQRAEHVEKERLGQLHDTAPTASIMSCRAEMSRWRELSKPL